MGQELIAPGAATVLGVATVLSAATGLLASLAWATLATVAVMAALLEAGVMALLEGVIGPAAAVLTFLA